MKKFLFLLPLILCLFVSCSSSDMMTSDNEHKLIDKENIKLNLEFLTSDELEGRETSMRGEKLAALYIKTELQKYGVKPFFGDTSYFQPFDLDAGMIDQNSKIIVNNEKNNTSAEFKVLDDFLAFMDKSQMLINENTPIIFAGYGITAPEFNYDDYANIDVKGKIVVVIPGEPSSNDTSFFSGEEDTRYSSTRAKSAIAKDHGALVVISVADKNFEARWDFIKRFVARPSFSIVDKNNEAADFLSVFIKSSVGKSLFADQQYSLEDLTAKADKGEPLPVFTLNAKINFEIKKNEDLRQASNVVGVIPGNDPVLKNEYVAIGAHYDHLGVIDGKIFNGADDDGSGTVTVLEVAKAFGMSRNNKRSILIVFHTGEEKGLLGSTYLTDHLGIIKEKKVVAQVNIDMVGRESADSIYSIGSDKLSSEMKEIVEEANNETVKMVLNYKYDDPVDPNRFYYRSDHYNYAKHGIPIVFFFDDMRADYHKDTDEVDKINFEKMKKIATLVYTVAGKIADLDHRLVVDKPIE